MLPAAFSILPFALSILPSACSLASPAAFPAASFMLPFACSPIPLMRSLSMIFLISSHSRKRPNAGSVPTGMPPETQHVLSLGWTMAARASIPLARFQTLLRLRHDPQIGPRRFPSLRIDFLRFVIRHRARDDHIFTAFPVDRRRHAMLRRKLKRIQNSKHFIEIAARGHRIDEYTFDLLIRPDDEYVAH